MIETMMLMLILILIASAILLIATIYRLVGPRLISWLSSNGEEKIGLSKSKLYNANGYIVHSGSDILLGSTGSFRRFESVDRNSNDNVVCENIYGQSALITPPWSCLSDEIPPQPLRPAPLPFKSNSNSSSSNGSLISTKHESIDGRNISSSAPIKSVPRPVPKKQMSAPAGVTTSLQNNNNREKIVQQQNTILTTTNPFLNGLVNIESLKTNFFSSTIITEEDERQTKSAFVSKNPFFTPTSGVVSDENAENPMFDFNPNTIKSILEETTDEGYLGDNDECDEVDPLKQLEERIQKIEALGKQRRKSSSGGISPKIITTNNKKKVTSPNSNTTTDNNVIDLNLNEKFVTSLSDENIAVNYRNHVRNRSFSETNETTVDLEVLKEVETDEKVDIFMSDDDLTTTNSSTNPFMNTKKKLVKTPSESYLEQFSIMRANNIVNQNRNNNLLGSGKSTLLCKHPSLLKILQTSSTTLENSESIQSLSSIKRAQSTESISSDSSVVMSTLERSTPPVTGLLCIALQYDKNSATEEGCELLVTVLEAKDLVLPPDSDPDYCDTFVRVYLVPDDSGAQQTKTFRNSLQPSYQEMFGFFITKQLIKRSLWFHLYHTNADCTTLIGETEMRITEIRKPLTTWLTLSDSRNNCKNWGDMMFSLSYLPTAERLTVVVVKARDLRPGKDSNEKLNEINSPELKNVYVKVYLLKNDKKVSKKRTSTKRGARTVIFNEAMIFSVPPFLLNSIQVRLTVMNIIENGNVRKSESIGHVIVGSRTDGKGLLHWHQMITSMRKPIAMFHPLRRTSQGHHELNKNETILDTFRF